MSDELTIDGEQFVSSKRASELSGYKQDYIGQLSRGGQIMARRVGGLWYISSDSLTKYMERADEYKPVPPVNNGAGSDPDVLLSFEGKGYISAARAAKLTGYSADYVGQMARAGIIPSRQVGNRWYVERTGILTHKESKDALLGAVQAASVGINLSNPMKKQEEDLSYGGAGPFLSYTSDTRELMPALERSGAEEEAEEPTEEHVIPIHVLDKRNDRFSVPAHGYGNVATLPAIRISYVPEKTKYSLVFPAVALTIIIVVSFGIASLKSSSLYTSNDPFGSSGKILAASAAGAFLGRVADTLEPFLAPELVYIREK